MISAFFHVDGDDQTVAVVAEGPDVRLEVELDTIRRNVEREIAVLYGGVRREKMRDE